MLDTDIKISIDLAMKIRKSSLDTEQVLTLIEYAENGGSVVYDETSDTYYTHGKTGAVTIWVSYKKGKNGIEIESIYSHRMDIKEDRV